MPDEEIVQDDAIIVEAVQDGDTEAFRHLVDRHRNTIYRILLRLVSDPHQAEELAQETFIRAWRALDSFRGDARFSTWLIQIAVHAARDHHRSKGRSKLVSLDELQEQNSSRAQIEEHRSAFDPSSRLAERELGERLKKGIDLLPASYREVFVLRHLEEIPYEEIAAATGSSVGSLKVRSHRARRMLREYLRDGGGKGRPTRGNSSARIDS